MPLMNVELLRFPSLCIQVFRVFRIYRLTCNEIWSLFQYFRTITLVCEIYPEKICQIDVSLQKNLVASLELGMPMNRLQWIDKTRFKPQIICPWKMDGQKRFSLSIILCPWKLRSDDVGCRLGLQELLRVHPSAVYPHDSGQRRQESDVRGHEAVCQGKGN